MTENEEFDAILDQLDKIIPWMRNMDETKFAHFLLKNAEKEELHGPLHPAFVAAIHNEQLRRA